MKRITLLLYLSFALGLSILVMNCNNDSVYHEPELNFENVEVSEKMLDYLENLYETGSPEREPTIEFTSHPAPIKRFRSFEDYDITVDLLDAHSRLTGQPVKIHQSLEPYLRYRRIIPAVELSLVNHEGKIIIGDTLFSLLGDSYAIRPLHGNDSHTFPFNIFDPVKAVAEHLTAAMHTHGASRVTEIWAAASKTLSGCGGPDDFTFVSDPSRSSYTDICVADFTYAYIRVNSEDCGFTPNAPGAVVMWNTSYVTWSGLAWAEAYSRFYKYRLINGQSVLDIVTQSDLPQGMIASAEATVSTKKRKGFGCSKTKRRTNTDYGGLSMRADIKRYAGTGTTSKHTLRIDGASGLPRADYTVY